MSRDLSGGEEIQRSRHEPARPREQLAKPLRGSTSEGRTNSSKNTMVVRVRGVPGRGLKAQILDLGAWLLF